MSQEVDPRVIENMDEWANRINEKIFQKETISIPDTVCALAAIRFIGVVTRRSSVLTPAAAIALLSKEFDIMDDSGNYPNKSLESN